MEIFSLFMFFLAVIVAAAHFGLFNDLIQHREKVNEIRKAWKKDRD